MSERVDLIATCRQMGGQVMRFTESNTAVFDCLEA